MIQKINRTLIVLIVIFTVFSFTLISYSVSRSYSDYTDFTKLTYTDWQSENGKDILYLREKNDVMGDEIYYAEGIFSGQNIVANIDNISSTISVYKPGTNDRLLIGFIDFDNDRFTVNIVQTTIPEITGDVLTFKQKAVKT